MNKGPGILLAALVLAFCWYVGAGHCSTPGYRDASHTERALLVIDDGDYDNFGIPEGHSDLIRLLKVKAVASQARILKFLEAEKRLGGVRDYRSFWITNAIWVEAEKPVHQALKEFYEVVTIINTSRIDPVHESRKGEEVHERSAGCGAVVIGADSLWSMGLTGLGGLVCIMDTGVDGLHPALSESWRGTESGVEWSEAWFDPVGGTQFPVDENDHGTFMAGLVLGREETDTTGVAPDARWIAARAIGGIDFIADILSSMQWACDPDGDPGTTEDVPDVLPLTWALFGQCDDIFWEAIDNLEAAGVTVVTSGGGFGPGPGTIGSPADRIDSPVNCFAVGTVDGWSPDHTIASFSSRGPSNCDDQTIKPEVVAPGVNERSCVAGGGYEIWSGSSLSTALIAGGILLLEQSGITEDPDQLKEALLYSAIDLGPAGEDNEYGTGLVNLPDALDELGGLTSVTIDLEPEFSSVQPGDSLYVEFCLRNPTSIRQTFETFLGVRPPVGDGFLLNRRHVVLDPVSGIAGSVPLWVPVKSPAGNYLLIGMTARMSPFSVIHSDTITVAVESRP